MNCKVACVRVFSALLLVILGAHAARSATIVCPPGDNDVIQACIDRAAAGDRIVFAGTYSIDPGKPFVRIVNKSNLTFVGHARHPPRFNGLVAADGRPLPVDLENNGFNVLADGVHVSGLTFDGLHFAGCGIAINLLTTNGGTFGSVSIRNLVIVNSYIGLSISGVEHGLAIRDSSIARADIGIQVFGENTHSTGIEISGNDVFGLDAVDVGKLFQTGIFLNRVDGRVHDNLVLGFNKFVIRFGIGIVANNTVDPSFDASVFDNYVDENQIGISLGGSAAADGRVFDNIIRRSSEYGVVLRAGANDWRIGINDIRDSGVVDVRLQGIQITPPLDALGTWGNTVYLTAGQTLSDAGYENTIIVKDD